MFEPNSPRTVLPRETLTKLIIDMPVGRFDFGRHAIGIGAFLEIETAAFDGRRPAGEHPSTRSEVMPTPKECNGRLQPNQVVR
jgi:hypothetical protein